MRLGIAKMLVILAADDLRGQITVHHYVDIGQGIDMAWMAWCKTEYKPLRCCDELVQMFGHHGKHKSSS